VPFFRALRSWIIPGGLVVAAVSEKEDAGAVGFGRRDRARRDGAGELERSTRARHARTRGRPSPRVVLVVGQGGVGKSRLAVKAASDEAVAADHPQDELLGTVTFHADVVAPVLPAESWSAPSEESPVAEVGPRRAFGEEAPREKKKPR